jgi:hypothetical protein
MKTKISWGTGILIGIIIFIVITVSMAAFFMTQDVHLVSDNYYEKELKYQQQIDMMQRTSELDDAVKINFNGIMINILFPPKYIGQSISGEIFFYRPSDPLADFKLPLQLNENGNQIIRVEKLQKGFWRLKLNWTMNGNEYYNERAITIN